MAAPAPPKRCPTARYFGTFVGKEETRHAVLEPVQIYRHDEAILKRVAELGG